MHVGLHEVGFCAMAPACHADTRISVKLFVASNFGRPPLFSRNGATPGGSPARQEFLHLVGPGPSVGSGRLGALTSLLTGALRAMYSLLTGRANGAVGTFTCRSGAMVLRLSSYAPQSYSLTLPAAVSCRFPPSHTFSLMCCVLT